MEVIHYPTKTTTESVVVNTTYPTTTTTTTKTTTLMEALIDNVTMDDQWTTNGRPMEPMEPISTTITMTNDTAAAAATDASVSFAGIDWMNFQNQALVILAVVMAITAMVILVVAVIVKTRLGKPCIYIRRCVRPSVRWSVCPAVSSEAFVIEWQMAKTGTHLMALFFTPISSRDHAKRDQWSLPARRVRPPSHKCSGAVNLRAQNP